MSDKPIYKEFNRRKRDVVLTGEGKYFLVDNDSTLRGSFAVLTILLVFGFNFTMAFTGDSVISRNAWCDIALVLTLLALPLGRLQYRLARFREIPDDWEDYRGNSVFGRKWEVRPALRRFNLTLLAVIMLFMLANSFSLFYLRSILENRARITVSDIRTGGESEQEIMQSEETTVVRLSDVTTVYIQVETSCTLQPIQVIFNAEPISVIKEFELPSLFWEKDYFVRKYHIWIDEGDMRDGVEMELTCGDLYQRYVFDLPGA